MKCPECDGQTDVKDSRPGAKSSTRRHRCRVCQWRFTTYEIVGTPRPYSEGWKDAMNYIAERSIKALILGEQKENINHDVDR